VAQLGVGGGERLRAKGKGCRRGVGKDKYRASLLLFFCVNV